MSLFKGICIVLVMAMIGTVNDIRPSDDLLDIWNCKVRVYYSHPRVEFTGAQSDDLRSVLGSQFVFEAWWARHQSLLSIIYP